MAVSEYSELCQLIFRAIKRNFIIVLVVRKVRVDFEGKWKRRRFKFLISFIIFKSFATRTFRTTQYFEKTLILATTKILKSKY